MFKRTGVGPDVPVVGVPVRRQVREIRPFVRGSVEYLPRVWCVCGVSNVAQNVWRVVSHPTGMGVPIA